MYFIVCTVSSIYIAGERVRRDRTHAFFVHDPKGGYYKVEIDRQIILPCCYYVTGCYCLMD